MPSLPTSSGGPFGVRDIRSLYPAVTENHLRYLEKWGLIRQRGGPGEPRGYAFADLQTIKHVASELQRVGTPRVTPGFLLKFFQRIGVIAAHI